MNILQEMRKRLKYHVLYQTLPTVSHPCDPWHRRLIIRVVVARQMVHFLSLGTGAGAELSQVTGAFVNLE